MMIQRCYMALLWVALALSAGAAPTYQVPCLERLVRSIGLNLPDNLGPDADNDSTWSHRGRALRVRTNAYGDISHIGYKLFDTSWAAAHDARPVLDFLERYALEEDVLKPEDKAEATSRKDITFLKGDATLLKTLTPATAFSLSEQERRAYVVEWEAGNTPVSLRISADCQTLMGANLIELEEMLERNLLRTAAALPADTLPQAWRGCPVSTADNVAVADGGSFFSDLIRARLYLRVDPARPGVYRVQTDPARPAQAVNNLLLTGCARQAVPLRLTFDKYGNVRKTLSVTLPQFVRYCNAEGCRLYLGVKERTDTGMSATLFAVNTKLAYCHTLSLIVPFSVLQGSGTVVGTLYAFTPLQNVTEDFFMNNP